MDTKQTAELAARVRYGHPSPAVNVGNHFRDRAVVPKSGPFYYAFEYLADGVSKEIFKFVRRSARDAWVNQVLAVDPSPIRGSLLRSQLTENERIGAMSWR